MKHEDYSQELIKLRHAIEEADAIVVGAGAGLSTAAGLTYAGERFERLFADFIAKHHFRDMYSAGFFPFRTPEEQWAYWSRHIWCNRYEPAPKDTYGKLLRLLDGKDFFVLTTNVDHQFQLAGFSKERLFYTQGDYGLWQCSKPCHQETYDNYDTVRKMIEAQGFRIAADGSLELPGDGALEMSIPTELVPTCPKCGEPLTMNLRADDTFVEDSGWHEAAERYRDYLEAHAEGKVLYLELGVGMNTPAIIKYPFWRYTHANPQAMYACVNYGEAYAHDSIADRSILLQADIDRMLDELAELEENERARFS